MKTRSFEVVLASPKTRFAPVRHHASPYVLPPLCYRRFFGEGDREEVPSAATVRLTYSVSLFTAIRKYGSAHALRTTTPYEITFTSRAKLVVDVCMGYFRTHDRRRACFPGRRGDLHYDRTMPHVSFPPRSEAPTVCRLYPKWGCLCG